MDKIIGALEKVTVFTLVNDKKERNLPVVYSESLESLNLLSSARTIENKEKPTEEFLAFSKNSGKGIEEIQNRYLRKPITQRNKLYECNIPAYVEQYGTVKGRVQDVHVVGYDIGRGFNIGDFREGVLFIPFEELQSKMEKTSNLGNITMNAGEQSYRLDRGLTFAVEKFMEKHQLESHQSIIDAEREKISPKGKPITSHK